MIRRHYLNFETRYQIPPVLTSPMEPQPFCSYYLALPCCGSVALLFFTTLWFQFVSRMSAYCLQKKGTVWPRFKSNLWNWERTSDRVKTLQNGSWKIALGAKLRTRWKLYKMALEFFLEYECNCLTIFGWTYQNFCWKKRSNILDKGAPFCRVEFVPYHFVGWKKSFCRQNVEHTIKWTTPTPPREF